MKKAITTIALAAILTFGSTFANAGIIVAGIADSGTKGTPCTSKDGIIVAGLDGIIVAGLDGIIVAGLTGIIVAGFGDKGSSTCTQPVTVNDGIIVAG